MRKTDSLYKQWLILFSFLLFYSLNTFYFSDCHVKRNPEIPTSDTQADEQVELPLFDPNPAETFQAHEKIFILSTLW